MKIDNTKGFSAKQIQQYEKNESLMKEKVAQDAGPAAAIPQEKVDLSDTAREIQQMKNALNEIPEVRESKVAALKTQIDNGTYNINGEEVAKKIVGESFLDIFA